LHKGCLSMGKSSFRWKHSNQRELSQADITHFAKEKELEPGLDGHLEKGEESTSQIIVARYLEIGELGTAAREVKMSLKFQTG